MTTEKEKVSPQQWARIEADYRAGIRPLRQIAAEYGLSEGAIRKRAKRDEWERDLASKIQAKAEAIVRTEAVREEVRNAHRVPESEVVEANAQLQASVVIGHRKDIKRGRSLVMTLFDELEQQCLNGDLLEQLGDLIIGPAIPGDDAADRAAERDRRRLQDAFNKAISLPSRAGVMKQMADSLKVLVALEREAFSIKDEGGDKSGTFEDFLDSL